MKNRFGIPMTQEQYAENWKKSSSGFQDSGDYAWMANVLDVQGTVLEIGSGTGISTTALLQADCKVVSLEVNPHMLHACERHLKAAGYRVKIGDIAQLPDYCLQTDADVVLIQANVLGLRLLDCDAGYAAVCCWLIGAAPSDIAKDAGKLAEDFDGSEMPAYRQSIHRKCFEVGKRLLLANGVVHLVDRTLVVEGYEREATQVAADIYRPLTGGEFSVSTDHLRILPLAEDFNKSDIQYVQPADGEGQPRLLSVRATRGL